MAPRRAATVLLVILASGACAARAKAQEQESLRIVCDPAGPVLELTVGTPPASPGRTPRPGSVTELDWIRLIEWGEEKNPAGDPLRIGTRRDTRECGDLTVSVEAGFLNSNAVGELGALEFPTVEVRRGGAVLVPRTALEECQRDSPRFELYGSCPEGYATAIALRPAGAATEILYERHYLDEDSKERHRRDTRTVR